MAKLTPFDEVKSLGLEIETRERIVKEDFVYILGYCFEVNDLSVTLSELKHYASEIFITNDNMLEMLKKLGIVIHSSGSFGTTIKSENKLKELIEMVREAREGK